MLTFLFRKQLNLLRGFDEQAGISCKQGYIQLRMPDVWLCSSWNYIFAAVKQYNGKDVEGIRAACLVGREVLDAAHAAVKPGITTDEIDRVAHEAAVLRGAYPSPLNYYNFPKSVCTSVNEVIIFFLKWLAIFSQMARLSLIMLILHQAYSATPI